MGMFDENVNPESGVTLDAGPALDPLASLGLSAPPMAPPAGAPPQGPPPGPLMQRPQPPTAPHGPGGFGKILEMALLGLAAGLGPRKGGGIPQGIMQAHHEGDAQRQIEYKNQQVAYDQQQQDLQLQQRAAQEQRVMAQRRQAALQQALTSIRNEVKTISDKATYDQRVEGFAGILQGSGYRIDANWLRQAVPYVAPSGKQRAQSALDAFFNNPLTKEQLKNDPESIKNGSIKIDLNGDGVAEIVPLQRVMEAAGQGILVDDQNNPVGMAPSTQGDKFQVSLKAELAKFRAENRRAPDPKEMLALVTEATKIGKDPKEPKEPAMQQITEIDPDTGEVVTSLVPKKAGEISRKPPKEPNQAQFQAGAYAGRMEQSGTILDQLEKNIAGMNVASFAVQSRLPPVGQSGDFQSYDQAGRNFVNALLRKESGAAISQSEFDNAKRQYLPQPGDTPNTLAQKKANRDYAFQTMKQAAGRGYQEPIKALNADPAASGQNKLKNR